MISRKNFKFPKAFRLHSEKEISFLFHQNNSFLIFPLKVLYSQVADRNVPLSILISIPKGRITNAVGRNHIKRLIKEAFRQNNSALSEKLGSSSQQLILALIYIHNKPLRYKYIEKSVIGVLHELESRL